MTPSPRSSVTPEDLKIRSLSAADGSQVSGFTCAEADLDDFLRSDALRLQAHRVARTYLAFHQTVLVGYMTVLADAIVLETKERKRLALATHDHPAVAAMKIARLAVSAPFRSTHTGVGTALVRIALALGADVSERMGCRLLTVDAYPESVAFYERLGFVRNRAKVYQGREHPSLRLDIFPPEPPPWAR
jgi:ribosomal protein S18 acetylase RimI-like enzyme